MVTELSEGRRRGYDVPDPADLAWLAAPVPADKAAQVKLTDCRLKELLKKRP